MTTAEQNGAEDGPSLRSSGVEALLSRLRQEGVEAGRNEAERIVEEARSQAQEILREAREQAGAVVETAKSESEKLAASGTEALEMAARDAVLGLKQRLLGQFCTAVRRLVFVQLQDEAFLKELILQVAGRVREDAAGARSVEILLPEDVIGLEDLRRSPEDLKEGTLTHFVATVAGKTLREGVRFGVTDSTAAGLKVRLSDSDIELDLSDAAVAELLLAHLTPRYRALLEGIVK